MNRYVATFLLMLLGSIPKVYAASIDEALDQLSRNVEQMITPIPGKAHLTVVLAHPILALTDLDLRRQVEAAFAMRFLNSIARRGARAVTYHDEEFYPKLRALYTAEFDRLIHDPSKAKEVFNEYISMETYDYLVLTRARQAGTKLEISSLVARRTRVVGFKQVEVEVGRVAGETWRLGATAIGFTREIARSEVFRRRSGEFAHTPSTPEFQSSGGEVEAKGSRVAARYSSLGRFLDEQQAGDLIYTFAEDVGSLETLPVQVGRWGLFLGYEYRNFSQEYRFRDEPLFESRLRDHAVGLGVARGNLHNGFIISAWGFRGEGTDETPGAELYLENDHMLDVEGIRGRLTYSYTFGRREFAFRGEYGESTTEYDPEYYFQVIDGAAATYELFIRYRHQFGTMRAGILAGIATGEYTERAGGIFAGSVRDESTILGFELGFLLGQED